MHAEDKKPCLGACIAKEVELFKKHLTSKSC